MHVNEWYLKIRYIGMKKGVKNKWFSNPYFTLSKQAYTKETSAVRTFMEKLNEARSGKYLCTQKRKPGRGTNRR